MTILGTKESMITEVRYSNESDIPWLLVQLKAFSEFADSPIPLYDDDDYAAGLMQTLMNDHVLFIAHRGNELLGFKAGIIGPHILNPKISTLTELFWWVSLEHRGTRSGALLMRTFINWGKENVQWINATLQKNSPVKEESLFKLGFELMETSYTLEVN